ncbi:protein yippee-like 2 [Mastomys coucha]|uniref:protein yippee-like 2 n=1 Tax=Mastomys coucha TaxID=35658 RepID=UPI001261BD2F|nr:protein yippee-like 2 [Mastomys coucha]
MVKMTRSKTFQAYLPSCHRTYSCIHCRAHLANHDELISKSFQGSQGRAYLFNSVVNVGCGPAEERVLLTGLHAVADIYCENCKTTLGWKYEHAFESSQKYKEGKYIIELAQLQEKMQDVNVSFSRKHSKISNGGEPGGARGVAVAWELLIASRKCKNENQSAVLQGSGRNMSDWSQPADNGVNLSEAEVSSQAPSPGLLRCETITATRSGAEESKRLLRT